MDSNRIGDVLLGATMVVIGVAPAVIILLGADTGGSFVSNFGVVAERPISAFLSSPVVRVLVVLFGLFLAGVGIFTAKYGGSSADTTDTPELY